MAITGPIGLLYVPSKLIVPGDAAGTATKIMRTALPHRLRAISSVNRFIFLMLPLPPAQRSEPTACPAHGGICAGLRPDRVPEHA
jgi:hypothetical protein